MRRWVVCIVALLAAVNTPILGEAPPSVSYCADEGDCARRSIRVDLPTSRQLTTVRIDTMASYVRYLFEPKQAVIPPVGNDHWFFFAYNDAYSHVRTKVFEETQLGNPAAWIEQDIAEWTGSGDLRYVSPTAYHDGSVWYPQATWNTHSPTSTWHQIDYGGLSAGEWSNPMDVLGPVYDYYLPLTEAGPDSIVYMSGVARDVANDSHIFKSFNGFTADIVDPPGEVMMFPSNVIHGQNYENQQLVYRGGVIVIARGGYRRGNGQGDPVYQEPDNPLLVVYSESTNGGNSWSDTTWLDQTLVTDMPGSIPGIQSHYSNAFFDALIEDDGDFHFMCAIVDSGCYNNQSYVHGMYDVHQEDGAWTASQITDGVYPFNPDSTFDPRSDVWAGDTQMHSPSLAEDSGGNLFAAWNDIGYVDTGTPTFDIWCSRSTDGGNTWSKALKITETPGLDEYFPRLVATTTDDYVYLLTMYGRGVDSPLDMIQIPMAYGIDPTLSGGLVGGDLELNWTAAEGAAEYWIYGALNDTYFVPSIESRLAVVSSGMTTWSSSNGVGDPDNNWTYLVVAVDTMGQELGRSNRMGEHDFEGDIPQGLG